MSRLHAAFALSAAVLLLCTLALLMRDTSRPWKTYQEQFFAPDSSSAPVGSSVLLDGPGRVVEIDVPGLPLRWGGWATLRTDRCANCHLGIVPAETDEPRRWAEQFFRPSPFAAHPRPELFAAADSPHPWSQYGCTVCHEGCGSGLSFVGAEHRPDSPSESARWRAQLEWFENAHWPAPMLPQRFSGTRCASCHTELLDLDRGLLDEVRSSRDALAAAYQTVRHEPETPARVVVSTSPAGEVLEGLRLVRRFGCFGCHEIVGRNSTGAPIGPSLPLESRTTTARGRRKVGPSLVDVGRRLSPDWIAQQIADPQRRQPGGRMPQLFGLDEHLSPAGRAAAAEMDDLELRAMVQFLTEKTKSDHSPPEAALSLAAPDHQRARRGAALFVESGCIACHRHRAAPATAGDIGPDLSPIAEKYASLQGIDWLRRWLRDPVAIHPRTAMPQIWWDRTTAGVQAESPDPVDDLIGFLMNSSSSSPCAAVEQPVGFAPISAIQAARLAELYGLSRATVPDAIALGERAIARHGCGGCHELPGGERPPIGPPLDGWASKPLDQLAFEDVVGWLDRRPPPEADDPDGFFTDAVRAKRREGFAWQKLREPRSFDYRPAAWSESIAGDKRAQQGGRNIEATETPSDMLRSADKPLRARLLMGRFAFTSADRAALVALLMSLTDATRPAEYRAPSELKAAELRGRDLFESLACNQCHLIEPQRWLLEYRPEEAVLPSIRESWPFVLEMMRDQADSSDRRGGTRFLRKSLFDPHLRRVVIEGALRLDQQGRPMEDEDDEGRPILFVVPWRSFRWGDALVPVGGAELPLSRRWIVAEQPPWGGTVWSVLYPHLLSSAQSRGESSTTEQEAFGWGPPPLLHAKQSLRRQWLTRFLAQPTTIRPASVMRMPRYALRPDEIEALAAYLTDEPNPTEEAAAATESFDPRAWAIVTDRTTFCSKCHVINDDRPGGDHRSVLAPDLTRVGRRLRGPYLRRWLAAPKSVLPYTAMPENFPPTGEPLDRELFPASSSEQLDAVARLLLHYDEYARRKVSAKNANTNELNDERRFQQPTAQ